jgi:hypothetical protein
MAKPTSGRGAVSKGRIAACLVGDRNWPDVLIGAGYNGAAQGNSTITPNTRLIAFINVAHALCHYSLLILPTAVLAMAAEGGAFGHKYGPILALATGMFVLYGLLSLPQGWLAARFGRRPMIATYFFGTGAALVASGFASTPLTLELTLAAAGAFAAICTFLCRRGPSRPRRHPDRAGVAPHPGRTPSRYGPPHPSHPNSDC